MGQHLQGVEGGIKHYLSFRHLALDGIGKAEEQRVARSEDNERPTPLPLPAMEGSR